MAVYYGMISMMDLHIGLILDKLDELDMANDTVAQFLNIRITALLPLMGFAATIAVL